MPWHPTYLYNSRVRPAVLTAGAGLALCGLSFTPVSPKCFLSFFIFLTDGVVVARSITIYSSRFSNVFFYILTITFIKHSI